MRNRWVSAIFFGCVCVFAGMLLMGYNLYEDEKAGENAQTTVEKLEMTINENADANNDEEPDSQFNFGENADKEYAIDPEKEMPTIEIEGFDYIGTVEVPVLNLNLPVMTEWSYAGLKIAPGRYLGSAYKDDLIIVAHNYSRHFGNLKTLIEGDEVIFTDVDKHVFNYTVSKIEELQSNDVSGLQDGEWDLTLVTCTLGGKTRVVVRCVKTEMEI